MCGLIGLFLFLSGRISVDAFGVILIGLLPGLEASGKLRIGAYLAIRHRPALHNHLSRLCYVRHESPPDSGSLGVRNIRATTCIRKPASAKAIDNSPPQRPLTHCDWVVSGDSRYESFRLEGLPSSAAEVEGRFCCVSDRHILKFNDNVIVLRDFTDSHNAVRWWKAANEAVAVVHNPWTIPLQNRETASRALELIAEITMIGMAILEYHGNSLRRYVESSIL